MEKLNFYLFLGKFVAKNRHLGNNIIFLQQLFRFRGGISPFPLATPLPPPNPLMLQQWMIICSWCRPDPGVQTRECWEKSGMRKIRKITKISQSWRIPQSHRIFDYSFCKLTKSAQKIVEIFEKGLKLCNLKLPIQTNFLKFFLLSCNQYSLGILYSLFFEQSRTKI